MILAHVLSGVALGSAAALSAALVELSLVSIAVAYTGAGSVGVLISAWATKHSD